MRSGLNAHTNEASREENRRVLARISTARAEICGPAAFSPPRKGKSARSKGKSEDRKANAATREPSKPKTRTRRFPRSRSRWCCRSLTNLDANKADYAARLGAHFLAPAVASRHSLARARSGGWLSSSRSRGRSESARGGALRDRVRGAVRGGGASSRASHRHVHQGGRRRGDQVGPARAEAREAGSVRGKVHAVREQSLGGRREQVRRARPRALPPRVARVRSRGGTPLRCVPSFVVRVFFLADALARARLRGSIAHARAPLRDPPPTRTRPLTSSPRPSSPRRSNQDASPVETQRAQEEAVQRDARRDDPTQRHDPRPALGG